MWSYCCKVACRPCSVAESALHASQPGRADRARRLTVKLCENTIQSSIQASTWYTWFLHFLMLGRIWVDASLLTDRLAKLNWDSQQGRTFSLPSQRNFPISFKPKVVIAKFVWKIQKNLVLWKVGWTPCLFPSKICC